MSIWNRFNPTTKISIIFLFSWWYWDLIWTCISIILCFSIRFISKFTETVQLLANGIVCFKKITGTVHQHLKSFPWTLGRCVNIKSHQNNFSPHFFYVEFNSKQLLFSWKNSKNASLVGKNALFVYKGICPKIHRKNWHFSFLHFLLHFFQL